MLACSYIEGDRMIACTVRQEASQEIQENQQTELSESKSKDGISNVTMPERK